MAANEVTMDKIVSLVAPARLRLPVLRDLRRHRLDVRLRALRRPDEEQYPGALVRGDGAETGTTSSRSTRRSSSTRRSGRRRATSAASPIRSSTAGRASCASARTSSRTRNCGRRPSKRPGEIVRVRPDRAAAVQPDVRDHGRCAGGRGLARVPAARDRAGHLHQLQERAADRAAQARRSASPRSASRSATRSRLATSSSASASSSRWRWSTSSRPTRPSSGTGTGSTSVSAGTCATGCGAASCAFASTAPRNARTTHRGRATSSTSTRSAGRSSRASRTAATSTSRSTPSTRTTKLEYVGQDGERYVPHVIEPAVSIERIIVALLADAYDEEVVGERERTVLRLHPQIAPVTAAILPLIAKTRGWSRRRAALYEEPAASGTASSTTTAARSGAATAARTRSARRGRSRSTSRRSRTTR